MSSKADQEKREGTHHEFQEYGRGPMTNRTDIKKIVREYCEQLNSNTLDHLYEMDKFLETHNLSNIFN